MRHFLTTEDWSEAELQAVIDRARALKAAPLASRALQDKSVGLLFFNRSTRTRVSFEVGVRQLGGQPVTVDMGASAWPMEVREGVVMDEEAEEHAAEAVPVLSRYLDMVGVRAFPKFQNWAAEKADPILAAFARHSSVPVVNMETIVHPCQELAHMMALQERLGEVRGKTFVLSWVWHPKPLNTAVANSALLIASKFGMNVRIVRPSADYDLDPRFMDAARAEGVSVETTDDRAAAFDGADVVYAKSWGALPFYGRWADEAPMRARLRDWIVDEAAMARTNDAVVSHCLPMRRNVKITDAVANSPAFMAVDEAENRLHVQKAMMETLIERAF